MKKLCLLLVVLIICGLQKIVAQNTYEGNVTLTTQAEVDSFAVGAYSAINGYLNITNGNNITDLSALNSLNIITNGVSIENNPHLMNLDFLTNVETLHRLTLRDNHSLVDVSGVSNATDLSRLNIENNDSLENLDGILGTASTLLSLGIKDNDGLLNIDGLTFISGEIAGDVTIRNNHMLLNLNGLSGVTKISGALWVLFNSGLESIQGLHNLNEIGDELWLHSNLNLQTLQGLNTLTHIGFYCVIESNNSLMNLQGLNNLEYVGQQLAIKQNQNLETLEGLDNISDVVLNLGIISNPALISLDGIESLQGIGRNLSITGNQELADLSALMNLNYISVLSIQGNPALTNLEGLNGLSNIGVINIHNNVSLTNIDALSGITQMSSGPFQPYQRDIRITNNTSLTNVDGLSNLLSTTGDEITVQDNTLLDNLCGFSTMFNNDGFTGTFDIVSNAYNPTMQDIIEGNCRVQMSEFEITYPKIGDHYIEGRNLRLQIKSDMNLPENQQFNIEYSMDGGATWIMDGSFNKDGDNGGYWVITAVPEPTVFVVRLKTNILGTDFEQVSNPFIVQPEDYYLSDGFSNLGISSIPFTVEDDLSAWRKTFSDVHLCLDYHSQDLQHKGPPFFSSCGKYLNSPIEGVIIGLDADFISSNGDCGRNTDKKYGKQIVVQSLKDKTIAIRFAHLLLIDGNLKKGDTIQKYQSLGYVGGSGTRLPHLHTSLYKNIYEWAPIEHSGIQNYTIIELLENEGAFTNNDFVEECNFVKDNYAGEFNFIEEQISANEIYGQTDSKIRLDQVKSVAISISPNPTHGNVKIENLGGNSITRLEIFSISSQRILTLHNPPQELSLENLSKGLYFIKILLANRSVQLKKLVIVD